MATSNFKKLALLGMAGGMLISSQAEVQADSKIPSGSSSGALIGRSSSCSVGRNTSCRNSNSTLGMNESGRESRPSSAGCNGSRASQGMNDNNGCGSKRAGISSNVGYYESNIVDNFEDAQKSGKVMSESDLLAKLSQDGKNLYSTLDPAAKTMALKMASQECAGKNECKGMNSCKSQHNDCAGKGGCKGTSAAPFKNKDDAVKLAAKKMAKKRALMNASQ